MSDVNVSRVQWQLGETAPSNDTGDRRLIVNHVNTRHVYRVPSLPYDCRPSVIDEDEIDSDLANFNFVEIFIEISRSFAQKVSKYF